jgi:hypothetical protein
MFRSALLIVLVLCPTSLNAGAVDLTGLYLFAADASGNDVPPNAAYTNVPNNGTYVLWTAAGGYNAPLLNGPHRDDAAISVPLLPGSHLFSVFSAAGISEGQSIFPGPIPPYFGLNLFFDAETLTPGISVFAATNFSAPGPFPVFSVDAANTPDLTGAHNVPGAGSLTLFRSGYTITLTGFVYSQPLVYNIDRIGNFDASPEGNREYVGQFTLDVEVAPVPEPRYLMPLGVLLLLLTSLLRRRRQSSGIAARLPSAF